MWNVWQYFYTELLFPYAHFSESERHRVCWVSGPQRLGLYFCICRAPHVQIPHTQNGLVIQIRSQRLQGKATEAVF